MRSAVINPLTACGVLVAAAWMVVSVAGAALGGQDTPAGLAELSPEDVQALGEARDCLQDMAADEGEHDYVRAEALLALNRVHEALGDWGRPGLADWYERLLLSEKAKRFLSPVLAGAQAACRGGRYHLGGVREFWRRLDAALQARGEPVDRQIEDARRAFQGRAARFEKPPQGIARRLKPLVVKVQKMNVGRHLKPYPVPSEPEKGRK
ncbi:MAG TPA: hypothetical protein VM431_04830 [Phycisphaerae bacterium]|nr:hypothetical protein [Phycisphaerae bacterium]